MGGGREGEGVASLLPVGVGSCTPGFSAVTRVRASMGMRSETLDDGSTPANALLDHEKEVLMGGGGGLAAFV